MQGDINSDNALADMYVKGVRSDIDRTSGYQALLKRAKILPITTLSHNDEPASVEEGCSAAPSATSFKRAMFVEEHSRHLPYSVVCRERRRLERDRSMGSVARREEVSQLVCRLTETLE